MSLVETLIMQSLVILILSISLAFVKSQDTAAADSSQPISKILCHIFE